MMAQDILVWSTAGAFLIAGMLKILGVASIRKLFEKLGPFQAYRIPIGLFEVAGGVALFFEPTVAVAAAALLVLMIGAIGAHLSYGGSAVPAVVLAILLGVILWLQFQG
jgi:uncharacterized membrane protein